MVKRASTRRRRLGRRCFKWMGVRRARAAYNSRHRRLLKRSRLVIAAGLLLVRAPLCVHLLHNLGRCHAVKVTELADHAASLVASPVNAANSCRQRSVFGSFVAMITPLG